MKFKLISPFKPTGDQPEAIKNLVLGLEKGLKHQVLLGVTGSGKTFTMANVIAKLNRPTLVISHNKTLAAQLYQEFKSFFPQNAVSYFVSYYDYYQPEAYIPQSDTYIEKEVEINEEIDRLRLEATTNILTRRDTIIVASVSCIYNIGSPREYGRFVLELKKGKSISRREILERLASLQYDRTNYDFRRGSFRVRGETIDIFPAYEEGALRVRIEEGRIEELFWINPLTGRRIRQLDNSEIRQFIIYPAKHYMTNPTTLKGAFSQIRKDLKRQVVWFKKQGKLIEAQRLESRVNYDLEMIAEVGYVNGIENYSRYFDGRAPGEPPYTLLDYFIQTSGEDWLLFIDESHQTIPQLNGMYSGDRSRKEVLIEYGFRLPAALDNRPLKFEEFLKKVPQTIYVSATPGNWEIEKSRESYRTIRKHNAIALPNRIVKGGIVEQLIRPTGLVDPKISIRPTKGQVDDLIKEIKKRVRKKERVLVTTLTKRMAEALASYLKEQEIKVHYLHSEIETLKRTDILKNLRVGRYDVVVGINLLREGLDLPEVSLVAILDADKEGFLRSETSLIQTMGRAARHINGEVIMYADKVTSSMKRAIDEIHRRRAVQVAYNKNHGIIPKTVKKPIREKLGEREKEDEITIGKMSWVVKQLEKIDVDGLTPQDKKMLVKRLKREMRQAAKELNFELATILRDKVREIESNGQN